MESDLFDKPVFDYDDNQSNFETESENNLYQRIVTLRSGLWW